MYLLKFRTIITRLISVHTFTLLTFRHTDLRSLVEKILIRACKLMFWIRPGNETRAPVWLLLFTFYFPVICNRTEWLKYSSQPFSLEHIWCTDVARFLFWLVLKLCEPSGKSSTTDRDCFVFNQRILISLQRATKYFLCLCGSHEDRSKFRLKNLKPICISFCNFYLAVLKQLFCLLPSFAEAFYLAMCFFAMQGASWSVRCLTMQTFSDCMSN